MQLKKEWIDNNKPVIIIGAPNSGKTNLSFFMASQCSHKNKYTLGYPENVPGFTQLSDKNDLFELEDCVVILDEFQKYYTRYGRHHNDSLEEALDFCEQKRIKMILTSQNNQAVDRNLESKIPCWAIKKINVFTLKQGGLCKVALGAIKDPRITSVKVALENNEFAWWNVYGEPGENGVRIFPNMNIGKDWKKKKCATKSAESYAKKSFSESLNNV